ncbi:MAG: putative NAD-dependent epimerase/dehydratase [Nitrospira sp.]
MSHPVVIVGFGYTGRHLAKALTKASRQFFATSREPDRNLSHLRSEQRLRFDLLQPESWQNIPQGADLVWCFPAAPLEDVKACAEAVKASSRRLVVLGSTSAYDTGELHHYPPPWLDETAPIDLSRPRVQGEEYLRKEQGAIVLRVAGIYGPDRNPLDWIRKGLAGPSRKFVNLIHVEDLADICLLALEKGARGEAYNVSDGAPRTWEQICVVARERWRVSSPVETTTQEPGKRIDTRKLREELHVQLRHPDLYESLVSFSQT